MLHAHIPTLTTESTFRDAVDKMDIYQFPALVVVDASQITCVTAPHFAAAVDVAALRERVLCDLERQGVTTGARLVAEHSVVMDPAYVHITRTSLAEHARLGAVLRRSGVHTLGRYGGWTYCSIEDNIVEARAVARAILG